MAIHWSDMMSVGVPSLDSDHRVMIGLINHLQRSIGDPEEYAAVDSVLRSLEEYAAGHFVREERMMTACGFPQIVAHQKCHEAFTARVHDLKSRYENNQTSVRARDCLDFLNPWLVDHICTIDMAYRSWMVGHVEPVSTGDNDPPSSPPTVDWSCRDVLVVDDNRNFREILTTLLAAAGLGGVTVAAGLDEARAAFATGRYGLVIADWHVGAESGLDLVRWIRQQGAGGRGNVPVLVLSAHEGPERREVALRAGADDFMAKPISAAALLTCLTRLVLDRGEGKKRR